MSGQGASGEPQREQELGGALDLVDIEVATIRAYEGNPRRGRNPEYERIKASIHADGLGQPLVVTQRPDEDGYLVFAGGNTRLRVLQELYAETGEARFGTVACVVRPWTQEADVLLAHLKENDLRGDLTFFDKALAVCEAKRLLEASAAAELTQTDLAAALAQSGYGLSQGLISQMAYVVERLQPLLPHALESGIGRPQVTRIRALDRVARLLWLDWSVDTEPEYDAVFAVLCRRFDSADWALEHLRRAIEAEIADRADLNIHAVSLEIDARLAGRTEAPTPPRATEDDPTLLSDDVPATGGQGAGPTPQAFEPDPHQKRPDIESPNGQPRAEHESPPAAAQSGVEPAVGPLGAPARVDIKSLRARLWTLATRLAQRNGLGDLVEPLASRGLGFVLRDVPDPALVDQLDEEALAQVSMIWWHLAACSELTVAPLDALLPALPETSVLRQALVEQDAGLLFASVWTLDPGHTGYRLWQRLDDRDWHDLLGLMDTYRALRRTVTATRQDLWNPP